MKLRTARHAEALLRSGAGLVLGSLVVGMSLIFHYFSTTPFAVCSAQLSKGSVAEVWPWSFPLLAIAALGVLLLALGFCLALVAPHGAKRESARQVGVGA